MKQSSRNVPATVDEYLAGVPKEARSALKNLRKSIRAAAPKATEVISYQIPTYKQNGMLIAFAAFTNHCSIFPATRKLQAQFKEEFKKFDVSGSTIRFTPDRPLPDTLIKKIVKARLSENEVRMKKRAR
ncbi:MAG: DUF1801 domain-containing protein [Bacteroidota bacterium]